MLNLLLSTTSSSYSTSSCFKHNGSKINDSIISPNDDSPNKNCHSNRFRRQQHQNKQSSCSTISDNLNELSRFVCGVESNDRAFTNQEEDEEEEVVEKMVSPALSSQSNHYQPPMSSHNQSILQQQYEKRQSIGLDDRQQHVPISKQQKQQRSKRRRFFGNCPNLGFIRGKKNAQKVFDSGQNNDSKNCNNSNNNRKQRIPDNSGFIDQLKTCLEAKIFLTKMYISRRFRTARTRISRQQHQQQTATDNSNNNNYHYSNNNPLGNSAGRPQIYAHSTRRVVAPWSSSTSSSASSLSASGKWSGSDNYPTSASSKLDGLIANLAGSSGSTPTHDHPHTGDPQHQHHKQLQPQLDGTGDVGESSSTNAPPAISIQERGEFPMRNGSYFASLFNSQQRKKAFNYKQRTLLMEKLNLLLVSLHHYRNTLEIAADM